MFAVIKTGGKQYRVAEDQLLKIEKIEGEPGQIVQLGEVLIVGGDTPTLGVPTVSGASVAVEVVEQGRGPKVISFKKRRRKNSRRRRGHRQEFTLIRISEILMDGKSPTKGAKPKPERKAEPAADGEETEAKLTGKAAKAALSAARVKARAEAKKPKPKAEPKAKEKTAGKKK